MGQSTSYAAVKDATIKPRKVECAGGMGQRRNDALMKDAQIKLNKEECAGGMVHTATPTMNLQLLDQFWGQRMANNKHTLHHINDQPQLRYVLLLLAMIAHVWKIQTGKLLRTEREVIRGGWPDSEKS
jgi:hypothetical protein